MNWPIFSMCTVSAGMCWYKMDSPGYCKETLKPQISKEKCCGDGNAMTAWSPDDLQDDVFFMWRTLDRGVPCKACQGIEFAFTLRCYNNITQIIVFNLTETCDNVVCGKNKKCMIKRGRPVCVCSPKCKYANYKKGPVCGTDNRSYPSVCRLKMIRCRTKNPLLRVNYRGSCQSNVN